MKKRTLSWLMATVLLSSVCMPVTAAEPQSWEIASMGSESGVSGEGSILQGVNKKNLSYEFTTVDEEKLSSASEGKPKILIFLNARCSNCRYTVGSLAEQTWVEDGSVDVYAVDFYQNSRDSVRAFGEAAGSGKVKLCYGVLSDTMYQYAWHAGYPVGGRISLPLIVLIDSNNKLQYATNGYTTGEYIESQYLAGLFREKEDEGASSDCTGDN
ncbi:MAG: TlpA family protein disulfide reductase, partial [Kineothrix sp.]